MTRKISLIIAGAGASSRFGGEVRKTYLPIHGKPVFLWALDCFREFSEISQRLLVVNGQDIPMVSREWGGELQKRNTQLVAGGNSRFGSVRGALELMDTSADLVAVHDAARPMTSSQSIAESFAKAGQSGAAIVAQQVNQTLKQADSNGCISHVDNRERYWLAQTPQVYDRKLLVSAYAAWGKPEEDATDDAQVVEAYGHEVHAVRGGTGNIKITTPEDLNLVEAILLKN